MWGVFRYIRNYPSVHLYVLYLCRFVETVGRRGEKKRKEKKKKAVGAMLCDGKPKKKYENR